MTFECVILNHVFGCFPNLKTNGTARVNLLVFKVFYPKFYFKIAHVVSDLWSKY